MRTSIPLFALLTLAAVPCVAQGIVVPVRCTGECPTRLRLPRQLALDSVQVWASLENGTARTRVDHAFRNITDHTVDAAFLFPLPADAILHEVSVVDASRPADDNDRLLLYNQWSRPEESRWIVDGLVRDRLGPDLGAYAGQVLVHVAVRDVPPGGRRGLQIRYTQPLRMEDGRVTYRYPLSTGARVSRVGTLTLGMQITTEAGFQELRSATHAVEVRAGMEPAPCPPGMACGFRGGASDRVKLVRMQPGDGVRRRDFEIVYTPAEPAADRRTVLAP